MDIIGADNRRYVNLPLPPPTKFFRRFRAALAVAESENSFEDTPTPPVGRYSEKESIQEEQHMTSVASDQIYCFKCRSKTDTLETQEEVLKNGRPALTGQCAVCGTKKFRMGAARK